MKKSSPNSDVKESNVQRRIYDAMLILRGINFVEMNRKKVHLKKKMETNRGSITKEMILSKIHRKR